MPRLPPWFLRLLAVLVAVLGLLGVASRASSLVPSRLAANDFTQDYLAAKAWAVGDDPYEETGTLLRRYLQPNAGYYGLIPPGQRTPHPPVLIVMHRPLVPLSYMTARVLWLVATAALIALGVACAARACGLSRSAAAVVGVGALALPAAQKDLIYAQSNGFLLVLLVAAWLALRRGRDAAAGVALGLATAIKLFPAFLVIPLLRARRWRALAWQAGVALGVTAASAMALGIDATVRFFTDVSPWNFAYWRSAPMNIPLIAIPYRWLTKSDWRPQAIDAPALAVVLALLLALICAVAALRTPSRLTRDPFLDALPFMLLATPIVWDSYLVLLMPLVLVVTVPWVLRRVVPPIGLLLALAAVVVGAPAGLPVPQLAHDVHQVFGYAIPTYGLIALGVMSYRARSSPVEPRPASRATASAA